MSILAAIEAVRVLLGLFALYCLWATREAPGGLWRGYYTRRHRTRAATWALSLGVVVAQIGYLFTAMPPGMLLLSLSLFAIGYGKLAILFATTPKGAQAAYESALDRPDLALPLVELARHDEEAAQGYAAMIRQEIALRSGGG